MKFNALSTALALAIAVAAPAAHADLISASSEIGQAPLTATWSQNFDDSASFIAEASGRVQIGASLGLDVGVTATVGTPVLGAPFGAWALGGEQDPGNGEWTSEQTFVGVDGDFSDAVNGIAASLVFDFINPVSQVGAFLNYDPTFVYGGGLPLQMFIAAYDANGVEIDSHFVPVNTPGGINEGAFFGISTTGNTIARFEVSAPYAVVDDLKFAASVPEPGTWALLAAGLGAMALSARRRIR